MADQGMNLTQRDRQVLQLVALGRTNGEIATELGITFSTAKWHISQLLMKVNVSSREELAQFWTSERSPRQRFSRALLLPFGHVKLVAGSSLALFAVLTGVGALAFRSVPGDFPMSAARAPIIRSLPSVVTPEFELQRGTFIHGADAYLALHSMVATLEQADGAIPLDGILAGYVPRDLSTFHAAQLVVLQVEGSDRLTWAIQWEPPIYYASCPSLNLSGADASPVALPCPPIDPGIMFELTFFDAKTGDFVLSTEQVNPALVPLR